jgi:hypothetical protein
MEARMNIQTDRLAFSEALVMLVEQYQRQNVNPGFIADDLFNYAEEMLREERRRDEYNAIHGSR